MPGASRRYGAAADSRCRQGRGLASAPATEVTARRRWLLSDACEVGVQIVHLLLELVAEELEIVLPRHDVVGREEQVEMGLVEGRLLVELLEDFLGALDR